MKQLIYTFAVLSTLLLVSCTDAGKDQTATAGTKVTLDASDSKTDMGGTITRYTWTQLEQAGVDTVHLFNKYTATPSFIAPSVKEQTDIKFKVETVESYNCETDQDSSCRHHKSSSKVTVTVIPSDINTTTSTDDRESNNNGVYTITVTGQITGTKGQAISGALVSASDKTKTTRSDGKYSLTSVQTQERVVISATHPDYFENSRVILVNRDNAFNQDIQIFKPQAVQTFDTQEGTTITQSGASVQFTADSEYLDNEKKTYKGNAIVKLSYYTIDTDTGMAALQGGYEGATASETFPLYIHGFVNLSLTDDKGNPLTLSSSSSAILTFPSTNATNNEPNIPLWTYDNSSGYWLEDTMTEAIDGAYVGKINEITSYGLHTRAPQANLNICVEDGLGLPISGANIIVNTSKWSSSLAQTDSDGELTLKNILAETSLKITASKTINGELLTNTYPSTVILSEGETRDIVDCIMLGEKPIVIVPETNTTRESTTTTSSENNDSNITE